MGPTALQPEPGQRRGWRPLVAATIAAAFAGVSSGVLAISPAQADTQTAGDGASATVADVVASGSAIQIEGTGWVGGTDSSTGSTIAVKLGDALGTEPASGPVTNPATGESADSLDIWAAVQAEADGTFSAAIPFPTPDNTNPALSSAWAVGSTHTLRLLTGSMKSGDTPRSVLLTFAIGEGLVASATTATTGIVTVALSGGSFPVGEVLSVGLGATPLQWTVRNGRTSTVQDTLTVAAGGTISASVVLPAGAAPAGDVTLTITGDQGTDQDVTAQAPPSVSFGNGTSLGASGTLTLGNLRAAATISSVKLGDTVLASGLTADGAGTATASYEIPADITPITYSLVITQTAPEAQTYTSRQAVYPDETVFGTDDFDLVSTTAEQNLYQGFYQSAYSAEQDALYVTATDRGSGTAGYLYKLDPETLAVETSHHTVDHDGFTRTGAFGIGVDDVHGNVWVSNTGSNSVAIYKASDLSLVKQFDAGTVSHGRDVVYDPDTDRVFVSSASEGSSATSTGYISVFEAADNDDDGTPYEKIQDVQTGTRDVFNPVSLALGDGKIYSPSLGSNRVLVLDTATLTPSFLTIDGIDVGGRGASGIAYDAATGRLFIASQNSNEVVIADATTGATIKEVPTGRGALNVAYDAVRRLAYVTNFGGTSVTVLNAGGTKVASLPIVSANHVSLDGKGNAFVVDKAAANRVWRISPKAAPQAAATIAQTAVIGGKLRLEGTGFVHPDGGGSRIAVKIDEGAYSRLTSDVHANKTIWTIVEADDSGAFSVDLQLPDGTTAGPNGSTPAFAKGEHSLRLLTGSLKPQDAVRAIGPLAFTATAAPVSTITGSVPTVTGTAIVGQKLTAKPGTWSPAPVSLAYQWLRNGKAIQGATAAGYTLAPADLGTRISVTVTGSKAGFASVPKTSAQTASVAAAAAPVARVKPSISGTPGVGKTLTAKPGSWSVGGLTFSYQWLRNGGTIPGATRPAYKVANADAGKTLSVRVTAARPGYAKGISTSAGVTAGKSLTATPTPKLTGTAKVGKTLKVSAGKWKPSKVTLKYQWLRDGAAIKGATKASYKLAKADAGHRIAVRVTGSKTGYASVNKVSSAKPIARYAATVKLAVPSKARASKQATVTVSVTAATSRPTGTVKVTVNGRTVTATLTAAKNGTLKVTLPKLTRKGTYKVKASFSPTGKTAATTTRSTTVSKNLKVA